MRLLLLATLAGCAAGAGAVKTSSEEPAVVATFGARSVTLAEVDEAANANLLSLSQKVYETRKAAAERIALEALVEAAAKEAGTTPDAWLESQVGSSEPSEAELKQAFESVRGRLPSSVTFEDARPRLEESLKRKAKADRARAVFESLKKKANYTFTLKRPRRPRQDVEPRGPSRGPADAKVTVVVFSDFQCPYCAKAVKTVERVLADYPSQVRLVYRHFPLSFHRQAQQAAEASLCADEQGRFWPFHDALYEHQDELSVEDLKGLALRMGLDTRRFADCLDTGKMKSRVEQDKEAGSALGVDGTPAYFVNGVMLTGARDEGEYRELIAEALTE